MSLRLNQEVLFENALDFWYHTHSKKSTVGGTRC